MIPAVVPVNDLSRSKSRLAGVMTAAARRELTLAMLADVLVALAAVPAIGPIRVVSRDPEVLAAAAAGGAMPQREQAGDLNGALAEVAATLNPAHGLLVVPADVPWVRPEDLRELVGRVPPSGPCLVIAPSQDAGTGALLVRPPGAVPFRFGPQSLTAHLDAARERGVPVRVVPNPRLALDVDRPEDLGRLPPGPAGAHTRRLLEKLPLSYRLPSPRLPVAEGSA